MILLANLALLSVKESEHIDGVFCVYYDNKQVSQFYTDHDAMIVKDLYQQQMETDVARMVMEIQYTHKIDLNTEVSQFNVIRVGDQDYVFAYNKNGQACDIFQYSYADFEIDTEELNRRCSTAFEGVQYCMWKYNAWLNSGKRRSKQRQSI